MQGSGILPIVNGSIDKLLIPSNNATAELINTDNEVLLIPVYTLEDQTHFS